MCEQVTEKEINQARESYRPAAARASLLYFILNNLNKINPLYQFSLKVRRSQKKKKKKKKECPYYFTATEQ